MGSSRALAKCETSQVLLAGVSGGFSRGSPVFLSFFSQFALNHFFGHFSEWIEGTLCAQLLLQFINDTFETLQTLWLGYTPQIYFCHFFYNMNLVIFWAFLHLESDLSVWGIVFHKHIF